ncbi:MAG: DNA-protecting protein DprA [Firmicutes bacterium]|nr:DNA-protecting protein DprA [Bacillota bacterium]
MSGGNSAQWLAVANIHGIGPRTIAEVYRKHGNIDIFFNAGANQLAEALDTSVAKARNIMASIDLSEAMEKLQLCSKLAIKLLTLDSPAYPPLLKRIYDPPPVLYYRGSLPCSDKKLLAVVGSRKATEYGRVVTAKLTENLVRSGLGIVSGLALGIDGAAHRACLEAKGYTVAVLGCGLDRTYPAKHIQLKQQVEDSGCVISEFPPGTPPAAGNFPRRNRIISGMCQGLLVVEAAEKSGAMITVGFALEEGRDVFAVPGNINSPQSKGTNGLIQQGAKLVLDATDILEEYGICSLPLNVKQEPGIDSDPVLEYIDFQGVTLDELVFLTGLSANILLARLVSLELKGLVARLPGQKYARCAD